MVMPSYYIWNLHSLFRLEMIFQTTWGNGLDINLESTGIERWAKNRFTVQWMHSVFSDYRILILIVYCTHWIEIRDQCSALQVVPNVRRYTIDVGGHLSLSRLYIALSTLQVWVAEHLSLQTQKLHLVNFSVFCKSCPYCWKRISVHLSSSRVPKTCYSYGKIEMVMCKSVSSHPVTQCPEILSLLAYAINYRFQKIGCLGTSTLTHLLHTRMPGQPAKRSATRCCSPAKRAMYRMNLLSLPSKLLFQIISKVGLFSF
jgi:hypothetical protein